ncbi:MAG: mechanosensitive ion channel [Sedimentisphaerales bacterium]|nr:mechanosensitive ion channel [Sedimentisphaerales bacterium]
MSQPTGVRVGLIIAMALLGHLLVRMLQRITQWLLTRKLPGAANRPENLVRRYPRLASIITILVSGITFLLYFLAVGLLLRECHISLTTYLASATVLGLAIGFGLQGFVQDLVIGLTLIFSDTLNIQEVVEISGQIGRVERIGLRFTCLVSLHGQKIYIPNRNISIIGRFPASAIGACLDVQLPDAADEPAVEARLAQLAQGMQKRYPTILIGPPKVSSGRPETPDIGRYIRLRFRLWPGQQALVETALKPRVAALMRTICPEFADWMVTVTYTT